MKPKLIVLVLAFAAAGALLACGGGSSPSKPSAPALGTVVSTPQGGFPISVRETDGQEITLDQPPQRIVSLSPHATEIICAIGAGDQLVAVDKFANCPLGSSAKPEVDSFQPNLEAIAGFKPDLVYVFSDQQGIVAALRQANIPVLYLALPESLQATYDNIVVFGQITGHAGQANALVDSMKKRVDAVKAKVASVSTAPRFFHEVDSTLYTVAPNTFLGELYTILKGDNIAAGASTQFPQLSSETVVARDPEVIVLADGESPDSVKARPGWANVSAVKNNRICSVDPDLVSRPGPRIVDGLEALEKCLYPGQ